MLYLVSVLICDMAAMTKILGALSLVLTLLDLVAVAVELLVELLVVAILLRVLHPRVLLLSCWKDPEEAGGSLNFGFSLPFRTLLMPKLPYPIWINVNEDCFVRKASTVLPTRDFKIHPRMKKRWWFGVDGLYRLQCIRMIECSE